MEDGGKERRRGVGCREEWCASCSGIWRVWVACHDWFSEGGCEERKNGVEGPEGTYPCTTGGQREGGVWAAIGRGPWGDEQRRE